MTLKGTDWAIIHFLLFFARSIHLSLARKFKENVFTNNLSNFNKQWRWSQLWYFNNHLGFCRIFYLHLLEFVLEIIYICICYNLYLYLLEFVFVWIIFPISTNDDDDLNYDISIKHPSAYLELSETCVCWNLFPPFPTKLLLSTFQPNFTLLRSH